MHNIVYFSIVYLLLCLFFVVAMHELAHVVASIMCGYKFLGVYLLFFSVTKEGDKWKVRKIPKDCRSISVSTVKDTDSSLKEYVFIMAAGGLVNLLIGIILLFLDNPMLRTVGFASLLSGIANLFPVSSDLMSDGCRIYRALNKETRTLELMDYNIAQTMFLKHFLVLENVDKLINSGINYYMVKGYYYRLCLANITDKEKEEISQKQKKLKFSRGLKCFREI